MLAIARDHRVPRDVALDTLWPDLDLDSALNNLHKALFVTRRALEPEGSGAGSFVQFRGDTLALEAPGHLVVDAQQFEAAAAKALSDPSTEAYKGAMDAYSGQLLPDDLYEDWSSSRRNELQQLAQSVLSNYSDFARAAGNGAEAIRSLQRMLEIEPELESAHSRLMTLFTEQGDRHRAIRQYQTLSQILRTEFGIEPQESTKELHAAIVGGRVALAKSVTEAPVEITQAPETGSSNPLELPPVFQPQGRVIAGRESELRQLDSKVSELSERNGSVVLISGPAGAGKSRLAQEAAARASNSGAHVLRGGAYEFERQAPYGPFSEALDDFVASFKQKEMRALVDLAPVDIYPLMPRATQELGLREAVTDSHDRDFLFAAVETFLKAVTSKAQAVLIVDDLHLADESTLELFHYLARRTSSLPLMMIGNYRSEGEAMNRVLARVLANIGRIGGAERIELQPLDNSATREIVESVLGSSVEDDIVSSVASITEGNPLFVEETVRTMQETGAIEPVGEGWKLTGSFDQVPDAISELLNDRFARLSDDSQMLLSVASVIGSEPEYPVLRSASLMGEDEVLDALDELLSRHIIVESGDGYRFSHGLHRTVALDNLSRARKRKIHTDVANGLLEMAEGREGEFDEQLAFHFQESNERSKAIPYLISSGQRAASVFANDQALELYSMAQELLEAEPKGTSSLDYGVVLESKGDVQARIGDAAASLELFKSAMEALEPVDRAAAIRSRGKAALAAINAEQVAEGEELLQSVLKNISPEMPEFSLTQTYLLLANIEWHGAEHSNALEAAEKALESAVSSGDEAEAARAYEALALSCHSLGDWKKGIEYELSRVQTNVPGFDSDSAFDGHL